MLRRLFSSVVGLLLMIAIPVSLSAKGKTARITIQGADLKSAIEITDPKILAKFNVWDGPGTFSTQPGFNAKFRALGLLGGLGCMSCKFLLKSGTRFWNWQEFHAETLQPSAVTSKPANGGQGKTGQREWPRTQFFYPVEAGLGKWSDLNRARFANFRIADHPSGIRRRGMASASRTSPLHGRSQDPCERN